MTANCENFDEFLRAAGGEGDGGRAYALPADAPLVKNLAAVWAVDPGLAAELEAALPEQVADIGVEWATKQTEELMSAGAPCVHYYIMQSARHASRVLQAIRKLA